MYSYFYLYGFFLVEHETTVIQGIKGLASGVFFDNLKSSFLEVSISFFLIFFI